MLYAYGFERVGVVVSDLYLVDPTLPAGREGPERGVRLEIRMFEPGDAEGSLYRAFPITVGRPLWRADLLESVFSVPGSLDRAHYHPRFNGWGPVDDVFTVELTAAPLAWLEAKLTNPEDLLGEAGVAAHEVGPDDVADLRDSAPGIMATVRNLLDIASKGTRARPPDWQQLDRARLSWL
ncbi:hypothetical protein [Streptomyces olivoreticuli]|uniref:hypothetical protein n=1 Tax=Streptomyces olivoreticuli TaxID=68246 RepID=UPI000E2211A5|nr:hypothetical protein [Streptomyces olivoreticuli]